VGRAPDLARSEGVGGGGLAPTARADLDALGRPRGSAPGGRWVTSLSVSPDLDGGQQQQRSLTRE
jgi:hypothetical protein